MASAKGNDTPAIRKMFSMALWMALIVSDPCRYR